MARSTVPWSYFFFHVASFLGGKQRALLLLFLIYSPTLLMRAHKWSKARTRTDQQREEGRRRRRRRRRRGVVWALLAALSVARLCLLTRKSAKSLAQNCAKDKLGRPKNCARAKISWSQNAPSLAQLRQIWQELLLSFLLTHTHPTHPSFVSLFPQRHSAHTCGYSQ